MKAPGGILALALGPKGKDDESKEESSEPEAEESSEAQYKSLIADAAKAGDWDAFADAVAGLVECSKE